MSAELMWKDATEQARLVRDREVSAIELVDAAIASLESAPELNVLVHADFEAARAAATVEPRVQAVADRCATVLEALGHYVEPEAPRFDAEVVRRSSSGIHAASITWLRRELARDH